MSRTALVISTALLMTAGIMAPPEPAVVAQQDAAAAAPGTMVDPALFAQGGRLYAINCAQCHQVAGVGTPPTFPALAGNDRLVDLSLIVGNVHNGKGSMPALPELSNEQVAALATYVRNAWGNAFGGATTDEVASIVSGLGEAVPGAGISVWTGVYTQAQDERGREVHSATCGRCHGPKLNGAAEPDMPPSPAIARAGFLQKWQGRTVSALFNYVRTKMPADNPGTLGDQQYIDAIAHMFAVSGMPAGDKELPPDLDALANLVVEEQPQ